MRLPLAVCALALDSFAADRPRTRTVTIENMAYTPQAVTARSGDRIVWVNKDLFPHTTTSPAFDSHVIAPGKSWTWTATGPGRYPYVCALHPTMKATVVIE